LSSFQILVERYKIAISNDDIQALIAGDWINDNIINVFLLMIAERNYVLNWPKVHVMNTFFIPKLMESGYEGVKRWTKNVDIFLSKYILIPVHHINHWSIIIVDTTKETIKFYDSKGRKECDELRAVKFYLEHEDDSDLMYWTIEDVENYPKQQNDYDCGIFTCLYAEFITREAEMSFSQKDIPNYRESIARSILNGTLPYFEVQKKEQQRCIIS
jgi:sentrin-specific protease 1